jgi:hypothetical protein
METPEKDSRNGHAITAGSLTVGQRVDRVNDSARSAWSQTQEAFEDLRDAVDLDGRVKRHPYGALAAAVGVGYVLGGGIFTPLTAWLARTGLRIGVRAALLPIFKDQISDLAQSLAGGHERGGTTGRGRKSNKGT